MITLKEDFMVKALFNAEGKAEGRAEGIEIGMTKGDEARKTAVVRNMLAQGMELSQICRIAECDEAFVEKVRREQM